MWTHTDRHVYFPEQDAVCELHVDFTASLKTRAVWRSVPGTKGRSLSVCLNERVNKRWPEGFRVFRKSPSGPSQSDRNQCVLVKRAAAGQGAEPYLRQGEVERPGPQPARGKRPRCCSCEATWLDKNPFAAWRRISWVLQWFQLLSLSLQPRGSHPACTLEPVCPGVPQAAQMGLLTVGPRHWNF